MKSAKTLEHLPNHPNSVKPDNHASFLDRQLNQLDDTNDRGANIIDDLSDIDEGGQPSPTPVMLDNTIKNSYEVETQFVGERIDKVAAAVFTDYSREQIKQWLDSGELQVNGITQKPKYRLKPNDVLELRATLALQQQDIAENLPLNIVYEDDSVLVINKPAGMVVHPGAGNWTGTLVNALLYHYPNSRVLPRAGLVHRIDKDTSGLLVVAKDSQSQLHLINQLKDKSVYRLYQALVLATPSEFASHRTINAPIARHPTQRTKMAIVGSGKPAVTHIEKIEPVIQGVSLVYIRLETGRTHQIRVHLSHLGLPLLGDPVYGSTRKQTVLLKQLNDEQAQTLQAFHRQALHAYQLGFIHPKTGEAIDLQAPLAEDIQQLIASLSGHITI